MPILAGETQSAFVVNHQILDGALIANEVIWWVRKKKEPVALLKLDFCKTCDSVKWSFLDRAQQLMGFGVK